MHPHLTVAAERHEKELARLEAARQLYREFAYKPRLTHKEKEQLADVVKALNVTIDEASSDFAAVEVAALMKSVLAPDVRVSRQKAAGDAMRRCASNFSGVM